MEKVYKKVSKDLGLDEAFVRKVYVDYWRTIRTLISQLPFLDSTTEDEFDKYKKNFNLTRLGKLYMVYDKILINKLEEKKYGEKDKKSEATA